MHFLIRFFIFLLLLFATFHSYSYRFQIAPAPAPHTAHNSNTQKQQFYYKKIIFFFLFSYFFPILNLILFFYVIAYIISSNWIQCYYEFRFLLKPIDTKWNKNKAVVMSIRIKYHCIFFSSCLFKFEWRKMPIWRNDQTIIWINSLENDKGNFIAFIDMLRVWQFLFFRAFFFRLFFSVVSNDKIVSEP